MSLQNYEIGSRVETPDGPGIVVKVNRARRTVTVHTDTLQQVYAIDSLEGLAARKLESFEEVEEWLEAPDPDLAGSGLITTQKKCQCPCGQRGACYWTVRAGKRIFHFKNSDCACAVNGCGCDR